MRRLAAAFGLVFCLAAATAAAQATASAETATEALTAFGILGTWSPDCGGPIRVTYAARSGAGPISSAVIDGAEQAVAEIKEAARVGADQIHWTSVYKKYSPLDVAKQAWMPEPGEVWETLLVKLGDKIRSLQSQRLDGQKVLVRDGFYYAADDSVPGRPILWRRTDQATPLFGRCPGNAASASPR